MQVRPEIIRVNGSNPFLGAKQIKSNTMEIDYFKLTTDYLQNLRQDSSIDVTRIESENNNLIVSYNYGNFMRREDEVVKMFDLLNFIYSRMDE